MLCKFRDYNLHRRSSRGNVFETLRKSKFRLVKTINNTYYITNNNLSRAVFLEDAWKMNKIKRKTFLFRETFVSIAHKLYLNFSFRNKSTKFLKFHWCNWLHLHLNQQLFSPKLGLVKVIGTVGLKSMTIDTRMRKIGGPQPHNE